MQLIDHAIGIEVLSMRGHMPIAKKSASLHTYIKYSRTRTPIYTISSFCNSVHVLFHYPYKLYSHIFVGAPLSTSILKILSSLGLQDMGSFSSDEQLPKSLVNS